MGVHKNTEQRSQAIVVISLVAVASHHTAVAHSLVLPEAAIIREQSFGVGIETLTLCFATAETHGAGPVVIIRVIPVG